MAERKYTLELTAEELEGLPGSYITKRSVIDKLQTLQQQVRADRERDDLRLPWTAQKLPDSTHNGGQVFGADGQNPHWFSMRAAKLMSAAPELLEAVRAVNRLLPNLMGLPAGLRQRVERFEDLVERALRKVETGVPE